MSLSLRQIKQDSTLNTVGLDTSSFILSDTNGYSYVVYTSTAGIEGGTNKTGDKTNIILCSVRQSDLEVVFRTRIIADSSNCLHPFLTKSNGNILYLAYSQEISSANTPNTARYNIIIRSYTIGGTPPGSSLTQFAVFPTSFNTSTIRLTGQASLGNIQPRLAYNTISNELLLAWQVYGDISLGSVTFQHNTIFSTSSFYSNIGFALFTNVTSASVTLSKIYKDTRIDPSGFNPCTLHGLIYDSTRNRYIFSYQCKTSGKTSGISTTGIVNYFLCDIELSGSTQVTSSTTGLVNVYYHSVINTAGMEVDQVSSRNLLLVGNTLYVIISAKTLNSNNIPYVSIRKNNKWSGLNQFDILLITYSYSSNKWNLTNCILNAIYNTSSHDTVPSIAYDVSNNYIAIAYSTFGFLSTVTGNTRSGITDIVILYYDTFLNNIYASQNKAINTRDREGGPIITSHAGTLYISYNTLGIVENGITSGNGDVVIAKYQPLYVPSIALFTAVETVNTVTLYWLKNPTEKVDQIIIYYKEFDKTDSTYKLLNVYLSNDINYVSLYSYLSKPSTLSENDITNNQYVLKSGYKYTFKIEPVVNSIFGTAVTTSATVINSYILSLKDNNTNITYTIKDISNSLQLYNYYDNTFLPDKKGVQINSYTKYDITYVPNTAFDNSGDIINTETISLNGYNIPKLILKPTIILGNDVSNTSINVSWPQFIGTEIDKYIINYGTTPLLGTTRIVSSNFIETSISGLITNRLYYFKLTISGNYMLTDLNDAPISANTTTGLNNISSILHPTVSGNSIIGRIRLDYTSSNNTRTGQNPTNTEASFGYYNINDLSKSFCDISHIMLSTNTPPVNTLTGISLWTGTLYDISASSISGALIDSFGPQNALNTIHSSNFFHTTPNLYQNTTTFEGTAGTTGVYSGTANTVVSGANVSGEWFQISGGTAFICNSLLLTGRNTYTSGLDRRYPRRITIAGSTNGTTWTSLLMNQIIYDSQTLYDLSYVLIDNTYKTCTVNFANTTAYTRYRVIFQEIYGNDSVNLSQCIFMRNYYPTRQYDILLANNTIHSSNIDIILDANNIYDLSSSSISGEVNSLRFATKLGITGSQFFSSSTSRYTSAGLNTVSITTTVSGITGALSGEWVQISNQRYGMIVNGILFASRTNELSGGYPRRITIVGSHNGTTWFSLQKDLLIPESSYRIYNINNVNSLISKLCTVYFSNTTAYRFYRVIIQEIYNISGSTSVQLSQCVFIQRPFIPNNSNILLETQQLDVSMTTINIEGQTYDISASSIFDSRYRPQNALQARPTDFYWHSTGNYNGTVLIDSVNLSGGYISTINTIVNGLNILGEWFQIKSNATDPIILNTIQFTSRFIFISDASGQRYPRRITIAGSNNGTSWEFILKSLFIPDASYSLINNNLYKSTTIMFDNDIPYSHYRVIFQEVHGNNAVNLSQCIFSQNFNPITFYNGNTYYPIIKTYNSAIPLIKSNGVMIPYTIYPAAFTTTNGILYSTVRVTTDTDINTSYIYFDISNTYVNRNIEGAFVEYKLPSDISYTETFIIINKITRRITLSNLIPGKTYNYRISPYILKYNSIDKIVHTEKLEGTIITKLSRPLYIEPAYKDISNLRIFFDVKQSYLIGANRYKIIYRKPTLSTTTTQNNILYTTITTDISISDISSIGYYDISAFDNNLAKLRNDDITSTRPYYLDISVSHYINTDNNSESVPQLYKAYIPYNEYSNTPDEVYQIAPATQIYVKITSSVQSLILELSRPLNNFINLEYDGIENIRLYYYISGVTPVNVEYETIDSSYIKINGLKPGNIYRLFLSYDYTLFDKTNNSPYNSITQVNFKTIPYNIIVGYNKPSAPILISLISSDTTGRQVTLNFEKKTSYIN